jgi:hypothetical protein
MMTFSLSKHLAPHFTTSAFLIGLCSLSVFSGCAMQELTASNQRYRCDQGTDFSVRFVDDSAIIDSSRRNEVLLRDAGGATPQQTVFSNTRVKAEFGLGEGGREAVLRYAAQPLVLRCVKA